MGKSLSETWIYVPRSFAVRFFESIRSAKLAGADRALRKTLAPRSLEEFDRIFRTQMVRKNYFMQILFLGKIAYEEGLPYEAHQLIFDRVKSSPTKVNYLLGNLLDHLPKTAYDFVSLSDTISYLDQGDASQILQKLHKDTAAKSQMVIRSFLKAPTAIDTKGWEALKNVDKWAHAKDGTGVYQFHIFRKK